MGKPPIPLWDRYGLGAFGALIAGLVYIFTPTPAERNELGTITDAGNVGVFALRVGDCFDDDRPLEQQPQEVELAGVAAVPCAGPHDREVYSILGLDLAAFPGQDEIGDLAVELCLQRFAGFVGREYETSVLDIYALYPTRESWAQRSDREVVCTVQHMHGSKLEGSVKGSAI